MKLNIDAILFDFMGVLLFKKENYHVSETIDSIDCTIGSVTNDEEFRRETLDKYAINEVQFNEILSTIVNRYEKLPEIWHMLPALRKKYKLAIINNGTALTLPALQLLHKMDEYFDLFISSAVEGIRKPDPKIFTLTCERLGVIPQRCLYMDDSKVNIQTAQKLGMTTIWWENKSQGFNDFVSLIAPQS